MTSSSLVLTPDLLFQCLQEACHGSIATQQECMKYLSSVEGQPGFIHCIISHLQRDSEALSINSKLLALICVKNSVARYWVARGGRPAIPDAEKHALRNYIFTLLSEPDYKISLQVAIIVGKVAQHDWPNAWPALFDCIYTSLVHSQHIYNFNGMRVLLHVLDSLQAKTLASSREVLQITSTNIFPAIAAIWIKLTNETFADLDNNLDNKWAQIEALLMCISSIRILLIQLYKANRINTELNDYFVSFFEILQRLIGFLQSLPFNIGQIALFCSSEWCLQGLHSVSEDGSLVDEEYSMSVLLGKVDFESVLFYSGLAKTEQNIYYVKIGIVCVRTLIELFSIPNALLQRLHGDKIQDAQFHHMSRMAELCFCHLLGLAEHRKIFSGIVDQKVLMSTCLIDPLLVQMIVFLSSFILKLSSTMDLKPNQVKSFVDSFFTEQYISLIFNNILIIDTGLLVKWILEPEDLYQTLLSMSEKDSVRAATEGLLSSMLQLSPDHVCGYIWNFLSNKTLLQCLPETCLVQMLQEQHLKLVSSDAIQWEALFTSIGLASFQLSERYPILPWLMEVVGPFLANLCALLQRGLGRNNALMLQIVIYRLLWMMSCWVYSLEDNVINGLLSIIVQTIESKCADCAVKLQAIQLLVNILTLENFHVDLLSNQIDRLLEASSGLISNELTESDSKIVVINMFEDLVQNCGPSLHLYLPALATTILKLWSGDEVDESFNVLRTSLLSLGKVIVKSMGSCPENVHVHHLLISVCANATSGTEDSSYLVKNGMELWLYIARNSPVMNDSLIIMFRDHIPRLILGDHIGAELEDLRALFTLFESYIILDSLAVFQSCTEACSTILSKTICNVRPRAVPYSIRPLDILFIDQGSNTPSFAYFLVNSGVLQLILRACIASFDEISSVHNFQTCQEFGKLFAEHKEVDVCNVAYLTLISRLLLVCPDAVLMGVKSLLEGFPAANGFEVSIVKGIYRLIIEKFDNMGYEDNGVWKRRICCFALLTSYPTTDIDYLEWFVELINIVDDVICEESTSEAQQKLDSLPNILLCNSDEGYEWTETDSKNSEEVKVEEEYVVQRLRAMLQNDLVLTQSLHQLFRSKMNAQRQIIGDQAFFAMVGSLADTVKIRLFGDS